MRIPTVTPDNQVYQINPAKQPKRYRSDEDEEETEEHRPREETPDEEPQPAKPPAKPPRSKPGPGIDVTV